jgi:hypothetical protein
VNEDSTRGRFNERLLQEGMFYEIHKSSIILACIVDHMFSNQSLDSLEHSVENFHE